MLRVGRDVCLCEKSAPGVTHNVPGIYPQVSPNALDIIEVGGEAIAPIQTRGFADAALVEADAPEPWKHGGS